MTDIKRKLSTLKVINIIKRISNITSTYLFDNWFENHRLYPVLDNYLDWDSFTWKETVLAQITNDNLKNSEWDFDRIQFTPDTLPTDNVEKIMSHHRRGAEIIPCAIVDSCAFTTSGSVLDKTASTSFQSAETSVGSVSSGTTDVAGTYYIPREALFVDDYSVTEVTGEASVDDNISSWTFTFSPIKKESISVVVTYDHGTATFTDNGEGVITGDDGSTGTIDYNTGVCIITSFIAPATAVVSVVSDYYRVVPIYRYPILRFKTKINTMISDLGADLKVGFSFMLFRVGATNYNTEDDYLLQIDSTLAPFYDASYSFLTFAISHGDSGTGTTTDSILSINGEFDLTQSFPTLFGDNETNNTLFNERNNNDTSILPSQINTYTTVTSAVETGVAAFPPAGFTYNSAYHCTSFGGMMLQLLVEDSVEPNRVITISDLEIELVSKKESKMYGYSNGWVIMKGHEVTGV